MWGEAEAREKTARVLRILGRRLERAGRYYRRAARTAATCSPPRLKLIETSMVQIARHEIAQKSGMILAYAETLHELLRDSYGKSEAQILELLTAGIEECESAISERGNGPEPMPGKAPP